ncbi:MAG: CDP-alcohol phosphatidyltransferase family protein [Rhizobiales bacterium]|nr:CDP-alcohol phosphatidyltransferase family protein [Hyphomicrobiales bacterium]
MSQSRITLRPDSLHDTGGVLSSSLTVALVTGAIGWYLVQEAVWQPYHLVVSIISFLVLASLVNLLWILRPGGSRFGEANQATLLRSGLVCLIGSALLASGQSTDVSWHLSGLIALALALDGVDGILARRLNLTSAFGARFDMEVDALLLLILSLLVWQTGQAGAWVLAIGLMRYAFVLASWFCPRLAAPLRPSFRRKTVCALQGIALLACLLPPLDQTATSVIAMAALATLTMSFGLDIRVLLLGSPAIRHVKEGPET